MTCLVETLHGDVSAVAAAEAGSFPLRVVVAGHTAGVAPLRGGAMKIVAWVVAVVGATMVGQHVE